MELVKTIFAFSKQLLLTSETVINYFVWIKSGSYLLRMRTDTNYDVTNSQRNSQSVELCSTFLRISQRRQSCEVKFASNQHRIRTFRKYKPGFIRIRFNPIQFRDIYFQFPFHLFTANIGIQINIKSRNNRNTNKRKGRKPW